jgi:hypothetical protein
VHSFYQEKKRRKGQQNLSAPRTDLIISSALNEHIPGPTIAKSVAEMPHREAKKGRNANQDLNKQEHLSVEMRIQISKKELENMKKSDPLFAEEGEEVKVVKEEDDEEEEDDDESDYYDPSLIGNPENGEELYERNCSECHGSDGMGGIGPSIVEEVREEDDEEIWEVIFEGEDGMPPFTLMPQEVADIVAWLRLQFS